MRRALTLLPYWGLILSISADGSYVDPKLPRAASDYPDGLWKKAEPKADVVSPGRISGNYWLPHSAPLSKKWGWKRGNTGKFSAMRYIGRYYSGLGKMNMLPAAADSRKTKDKRTSSSRYRYRFGKRHYPGSVDGSKNQDKRISFSDYRSGFGKRHQGPVAGSKDQDKRISFSDYRSGFGKRRYPGDGLIDEWQGVAPGFSEPKPTPRAVDHLDDPAKKTVPQDGVNRVNVPSHSTGVSRTSGGKRRSGGRLRRISPFDFVGHVGQQLPFPYQSGFAKRDGSPVSEGGNNDQNKRISFTDYRSGFGKRYYRAHNRGLEEELFGKWQRYPGKVTPGFAKKNPRERKEEVRQKRHSIGRYFGEDKRIYNYKWKPVHRNEGHPMDVITGAAYGKRETELPWRFHW